MGILDTIQIFSNNEEKQQLNAEERERDFVKKRDVFAAGMQDDSAYQQTVEYRNDLIRWQQELDDELFSLVKTILGFEKIGDEWIERGEPLANQKFITDVILPQCKPFLSRNMINSKFEEKRILLDLRNTCDDIASAMADAYDKYEINFINFDLIMRLIKNTIKSGAFRALKGWTKQMDSTMIKRIEAFNESDSKGMSGGSKSILGAWGK